MKKSYRQVALLLLLLAFSCLSVLTVGTPGDDLKKLDPLLKRVVIGQEILRAPILHQRKPGFVNTIIKVSGDPMSVKSVGVQIRSVIGGFVTADVPLRSLPALASLPNVIYVQSARKMRESLLDVSVPDTNADQVWRSIPGYTGKGAIVGIIDSGIDWDHPDFMGKDGTSRILYIWDQTVHTPAQYPKGFGYGTEWTKAQIDARICREMDADSHGTHVASTSAGNSQGRHEFNGMAPDANIIVVKTDFDDADILDASVYIFQKAEELGMPAVINMSFGSQWGPHDGTELLDQALDELLDRPGRAIVASAGNDGDTPVHVGTRSLRQPYGRDYPWVAVRPLTGTGFVPIQIWYPPTRSISVRLLLPKNDNGDLGDIGIGWVSKGEFRVFLVQDGPIAGAEVVIDAQQLASGSLYPNFNSIYIHIYDNEDLSIPVDEYIYAVEFDGAGVSFDAYTPYYAIFTGKLPSSVSFPNRAFLLEGDGEKTIISPASASKVICVGSYVTKSEWIDSENRLRSESLKVDDISVFSSRGPLLNGGRKPDISAPGEMIVAAFSSESWDRPRSIYRDGEHVSWHGTSMSAPHVAGAIALMYEQDPLLTAMEVKHRLTNSAIDRGPPGWDKAWGYGKLDVLMAMNIPSAPRGLSAIPSDRAIMLKWAPNPENNIAGYKIYIRPNVSLDVGNVTSYRLENLPNGVPVFLSVSAYNTAGNEGPRTSEIAVTPGISQPDTTPPSQPKGLSVMSVNTAVFLKWMRGNEYDLAGYRIYYGTSSGNYNRVITVGDVSGYMLENLTNGVRIYLALTAYDAEGNESEKSEEVSAVPQLFPKTELRYQGGWPVKMGQDVYSSPSIYDVDKDGRMEVAISTRDGSVSLLRYDGRFLPGWPILTGSTSISSPALCDVDGDGFAEVIACSGQTMYMWRHDGKAMPGWSVKTGGNIIASPALSDIDGDGSVEIVIGSMDGRVYAFERDGLLVSGWPVRTDGPIRTSPAIGDIDGDGRMDIVIGSDNGSIYVFNGDGTMRIGWPVRISTQMYSSPVLGDIDGDSELEIVTADKDGIVYALRYNGDPLAGWPVDLRGSISASPALGDIDGDKVSLEVVICTRSGLIYVLKYDGSAMDGWPVSVIGVITSSPALGDIDSDGDIEVIIGTSTEERYVGLIYAFDKHGKRVSTMWPAYTEGNIYNSSPALGDLDGDGDIEVVIGSCRRPDGTGGELHAWDLAGRLSEEKIPWGEFRHNPRHTGIADDIIPPSFTIVVLQNSALKKYVDIYVIASEQLNTTPELTVEVDGTSYHVTLNMVDAVSHIYSADYLLELDGLHTFTVIGTDMRGNVGRSSRTVQLKQKENEAPAKFSLLPNYPNPFNPGTWIPYELAKPADVTICIYNVRGQLVRTLSLGDQPAGSYISKESAGYWDGRDDCGQEVAPGIYFYALKAGEFTSIRKMSLLR